jgi:septal ring factor EnvC (AmiA/AmiB activator)
MTHIPGVRTRDEIVRRLADLLADLNSHQVQITAVTRTLESAVSNRDECQREIDTLYAELAAVMGSPDEQR